MYTIKKTSEGWRVVNPAGEIYRNYAPCKDKGRAEQIAAYCNVPILEAALKEAESRADNAEKRLADWEALLKPIADWEGETE